MLEAQTKGGKQKKWYLTELGVYRLILNSNKPIAAPFKKWVAKLIRFNKRI